MEEVNTQEVFKAPKETLFPSEESEYQHRFDPVPTPLMQQDIISNEQQYDAMNLKAEGFTKYQVDSNTISTTTHSNNLNIQHMEQVQTVQSVLVEQIVPPEDMSDLVFAMIIFIIGLFVFPLILVFSIFLVKSKNAGAKVIATLSLIIFILEFVFVCSAICCTMFITLLSLMVYGLAILLPVVILSVTGK
eukprot:gene12579-6399_t